MTATRYTAADYESAERALAAYPSEFNGSMAKLLRQAAETERRHQEVVTWCLSRIEASGEDYAMRVIIDALRGDPQERDTP